MKSLYNEFETASEEGQKIAKEMEKYVIPYFKDPDLNPREISHVLIQVIMGCEAEETLRRAAAKRKAERNEWDVDRG